MKELILGGVRCGKSRLAAERARALGYPITVIATARAGNDEEMQQRIAAHRAARPPEWRVVEEPIALARTLREHAGHKACVIVECLTLWLTNLLCDARPGLLAQQRAALLEAIPHVPGCLIFVANETNLGVHPMGRTARRFCDEAGRTQQAIAGLCDRVTFVVAGLPMTLKDAAR